jgi:hypothetical protein
VITYVRAILEEGPEEDDLTPRLEAELAERVRRGGLRLPGAPPGLVGRFDRDAR